MFWIFLFDQQIVFRHTQYPVNTTNSIWTWLQYHQSEVHVYIMTQIITPDRDALIRTY